MKYSKLKYGLSLLQKHEKYKKYIFRIIFYVSFIKNDKQTKKGKEINIFKSLARSNAFSTKSEEQEVNLEFLGVAYIFQTKKNRFGIFTRTVMNGG